MENARWRTNSSRPGSGCRGTAAEGSAILSAASRRGAARDEAQSDRDRLAMERASLRGQRDAAWQYAATEPPEARGAGRFLHAAGDCRAGAAGPRGRVPDAPPEPAGHVDPEPRRQPMAPLASPVPPSLSPGAAATASPTASAACRATPPRSRRPRPPHRPRHAALHRPACVHAPAHRARLCASAAPSDTGTGNSTYPRHRRTAAHRPAGSTPTPAQPRPRQRTPAAVRP